MKLREQVKLREHVKLLGAPEGAIRSCCLLSQLPCSWRVASIVFRARDLAHVVRDTLHRSMRKGYLLDCDVAGEKTDCIGPSRLASECYLAHVLDGIGTRRVHHCLRNFSCARKEVAQTVMNTVRS